MKGRFIMKNRRKYWWAALAAAVLIALLPGCSTEEDMISSAPEPTSSPVESEETMVEITIPAGYFEGKTLAEIEKSAKAQGVTSVSQLEDGSYKYEMTASAQRRLVSEMRLNLLDAVSEIVDEETYPSVQSAELSGDLSQLTLTVDGAAYQKGNDRTIVRAIWPSMEIYYYFNSENPDEKTLKVVVQNGEDGKEVETFQWPESKEEKAESSTASSEPEKEAAEEPSTQAEE